MRHFEDEQRARESDDILPVYDSDIREDSTGRGRIVGYDMKDRTVIKIVKR